MADIIPKAFDGMTLSLAAVPLKGNPGEQGKGLRGDPGDSNYQLWLKAGNTGSLEDFLIAMKGEKGDEGKGLTNRGNWQVGPYMPGDYVFADGTQTVTSMWIYRGNEEFISTIPPNTDPDNWIEFAADTGKPLELRNTGEKIQWRIEGDVEWIDLIFVADLRGPAGQKGEKGDKGDAGTGLNNRGTWAAGTYQPGDYVFSAGTTATTSMWILSSTTAYVSNTAPMNDTSHWIEFAAPSGPKGDDGDDGLSVNLRKTATAIQYQQTGSPWTDLVLLSEIKGDQGVKGDQGIQGIQGVKGDTGQTGAKGDKGDPGTTDYTNLSNKPSLGTAAAKNVEDFTTPSTPSFSESLLINRVNTAGVEATLRTTAANAPVIHYEYRNESTSDGRPLANQLIGAAGARPWAGSDWTPHSAAAYHFGAAEDHTATSQATFINLSITPYGATVASRYAAATFNADGDIINSKGLTLRMVNSVERGRGIQVLRNGAAEISMVGSDPSGYSTLLRSFSFGGGNINSPQATPASNGTGFAFCGHDGVSWTGAKAIVKLGSGLTAWTQTSTPTFIDVETTASGSTTRTLRLRIMDTGSVYLANSVERTDTPSSGLYIWSENGECKIKTSSGVVKEVAPSRTSVQAVRDAAAVSLTTGSYASVIYTLENVDTLSEYNPSTGVFTPKTAGLYLIQCSCHLGGVPAGAEIVLRVRVGGTEIARVYNSTYAAGGNTVANGTAMLQLAVNATVDFQIYVGGSGTPSILANSVTGTRLGIQKLA
ncbi:L-shaped tail fiber protein [Xanthomonas phage RiverRider]|uniref:L-shaped tail fiber protein n=1 Tax=Xanthomonas phage RiverRider TaxID=2108116 RepID=A0A2P1JUV4_9CAUD|nr:tail protein [Xanthomonas phage RiverRider]AVO23141.1 L-shaped tail fiber protein [Xanthomonas phage RiverRider]